MAKQGVEMKLDIDEAPSRPLRPSLSVASPSLALDMGSENPFEMASLDSQLDALVFDSSDLFRRVNPNPRSPPLLARGNSVDSLPQLTSEATTPLNAPVTLAEESTVVLVEESDSEWQKGHLARVLELLAAAHAANAPNKQPA